jgi:hypothetical protein
MTEKKDEEEKVIKNEMLFSNNFHTKVSNFVITIMGRRCFVCGKKITNGNSNNHHSLPKVLKPKYNVVVPTCLKCHEKINSLYLRHLDESPNQIPQNFKEFRKNYENLREEFYAGKMDRSKFGEGLWVNLMNYLEKVSKKWN